MCYNSIWIFLVILQACVTSLPIQDRYDLDIVGHQKPENTSPDEVKYHEGGGDEKVISVRITSSVAVGRGKAKLPYTPKHNYESDIHFPEFTSAATNPTTATLDPSSHLPSNLIGANIEYIKQLNAKKDSGDFNAESLRSFVFTANNGQNGDNESYGNESPSKIEEYDDVKNIPTARKIPSAADANSFHAYNENRRYQYQAHNDPDPVDFGLKINVETGRSVVNETEALMMDQQAEENKNRAVAVMPKSDSSQIHDSIAESSVKTVDFTRATETAPPLPNYVNRFRNNRHYKNERGNARLTTVSFNIIHDLDATKPSNDNEHSESYVTSSQVVPNQHQFYNSPKVYSQPSKVYSEPSKFYSEPAKVYSEPAKIYSEPAKVYSEPAKIYSEPAKFYSEPASLHLDDNGHQVPPSAAPNFSQWQSQGPNTMESSTIHTTPVTAMSHSYKVSSMQMEHQPEKNYEIEENISVLTDGRSHGVQESSTEKCKQDNCKVGYVVEGRQYKKYRVEERTSDGFIVGEYGVVRNEDGALRGVRYTADSDASPRLIHDALMKFLQLK